MEAETITKAGDPRGVICEAVEKLNIQLLVLGSHSPGVIERFVLFSTFLIINSQYFKYICSYPWSWFSHADFFHACDN